MENKLSINEFVLNEPAFSKQQNGVSFMDIGYEIKALEVAKNGAELKTSNGKFVVDLSITGIMLKVK